MTPTTRPARTWPTRALLLAALCLCACRREREPAAGGGSGSPPRATPVATPAPPPPSVSTPAPTPATRRPETSGGAVATTRSAPRPAPEPAPAAGRCTVARVTDGDTVRCADGTRLRLLLIDAPELAQKPFGAQARNALAHMLPAGSLARYETDQQRRDRYGRVLAYVYGSDGRMLNEEMLRGGFAVILFYQPNDRYLTRFEAIAESASIARRGFHADSNFTRCEPRDFRRKRCR